MLVVIVVVLVVVLVVMMMMMYVLPLFSSNKLDDDCNVGGDCGGVGNGGNVQAATFRLRYSCGNDGIGVNGGVGSGGRGNKE